MLICRNIKSSIGVSINCMDTTKFERVYNSYRRLAHFRHSRHIVNNGLIIVEGYDEQATMGHHEYLATLNNIQSISSLIQFISKKMTSWR